MRTVGELEVIAHIAAGLPLLTFGVYLVAKGFTSPARRHETDVRRATAPVAALV